MRDVNVKLIELNFTRARKRLMYYTADWLLCQTFIDCEIPNCLEKLKKMKRVTHDQPYIHPLTSSRYHQIMCRHRKNPDCRGDL